MASTQFFFGVGAQKAGTTWLHDALSKYPDCAVPPVKELHFFDFKYRVTDADNSPIYKERLGQLATMAQGFRRDVNEYFERVAQIEDKPAIRRKQLYQDDYLAHVNVERRLENIARLARFLQIRNSDDYVNYLHEVGELKGATTVGEFTPAYSLLPAEAFQEMDALFPGAKFIFIMRDPVERFLSHLRFKKKVRSRRGGPEFVPKEKLEASLQDPAFIERGHYGRVIETLETVVPGSRILYLFFEEMVSAQRVVPVMRAVEKFLGLQPKEEEFLRSLVDVKLNVSEPEEFSAQQVEHVYESFHHVYEFVEKRFGRTPLGWRRAV